MHIANTYCLHTIHKKSLDELYSFRHIIYSPITTSIKNEYAHRVNQNISEDYPDDWNMPPAAVVTLILTADKQTLLIYF